MLKRLALAVAFSLFGSGAYAACAYDNTTSLKMLASEFAVWKVVTDAMAECGNFEAELDPESSLKQPAAFAASPSLYHLGGVSNSSLAPLLDQDSIRPLDDLVAEYGQHLKPNQLIKVDGKTMAIAMMVNTKHLMYRQDIFTDLGLSVPKTYGEVLAAARIIKEAGVVDYPFGGSFKTGSNIGVEFINMHLGMKGEFIDAENRPIVNTPTGVATLRMLRRLTTYMDPEFTASDTAYVQQQLQQGKIAMSSLWASRAATMDDPDESQVVGLVQMASAPHGTSTGRPASSLWWDGIVVAKNITDAEAKAAFQVAMEGLDSEMVQANNDLAIWLIDGFEPDRLAKGAAATAANGAEPYAAGTAMGLMLTALGNGVNDFLTGAKDAVSTLSDIEEAYLEAAEEQGLLEAEDDEMAGMDR